MTDDKDIKNSALAQLGELPRIGLGSADIGLGFAHQYALELTETILKGVKQVERDEILNDLLIIFNHWKDDHGVYPPNNGFGLFGLGNRQEPESAKDYCERIKKKANKDGKEPIIPEPWQCCPHVSTPVALFEKLFSENYKPMSDYMDRNGYKYSKIKAILILKSHLVDSNYQSSDCIRAALNLASYEISHLKGFIGVIIPDAEMAFQRRKRKRILEKEKAENTRQTVLTEYQRLKNLGRPFKYRQVADNIGVSEATVSRALLSLNIKKYKK